MVPDDLKTLANDILRANSEAETYRLVARLTAKETDAVARLVEIAAMKAWVERECAKGCPESKLTWPNWVRELGFLYRYGLRA